MTGTCTALLELKNLKENTQVSFGDKYHWLISGKRGIVLSQHENISTTSLGDEKGHTGLLVKSE